MRWLLSFLLLFPMLAWAGGININTATESELETLPGIGASKAAAIIQYRTDHGPFKAVGELDNVPGIGPSTLANLTPLVTVGDGKTVSAGTPSAPVATAPATPDEPTVSTPPTEGNTVATPAPAAGGCPVNINTADASGLGTLPGIGDSKAAAIFQYRTEHGRYASCDALDDVPGIGPATINNLRDCCVVK